MDGCIGCGAAFPPVDGPTHDYMLSSPACFAAFNTLLAAEYATPSLAGVHRLTVDTYAVQHPGDPADRRAVQSVGLHLARLMLQLDSPRPPRETNAVMLRFARHKATLRPLAPPARFVVTVADVAPFAGTPDHAARVRAWAEAAWQDLSGHHAYIRAWVAEHAGPDHG